LKSIRWFRTKDAMNLFWLFCIYFGFTFTIRESTTADSARIIMHFKEMSISGTSLSEILGSFYSSGSNNIDIVQSLISFIVSRFTSDFRILYAVFGLVFGYFYSRNIWLLVNKTNSRILLLPVTVLLAFVVVNGIWNINGFRYYTAAQIFIYGALSFFLEGKKHKLLFAALSILVHWSFMIAVLILLFYIIVRNRTRIYFILFVVSFFMAAIEMDIIRQLFESYAPATIQESRSGYLNPHVKESIEKSQMATNWYIRGHLEVMKWFIFISFVYIFLRGIRRIKLHKQLLSLFNFSLLFYAIINIVSGVPSIGRFYTIANMLSLALIFLYLQKIDINFSPWLKRIAMPLLLLYIIVKLRFAFEFLGVTLLFGNPLFAWLVKDQIPLIDIIKGLI